MQGRILSHTPVEHRGNDPKQGSGHRNSGGSARNIKTATSGAGCVGGGRSFDSADRGTGVGQMRSNPQARARRGVRQRDGIACASPKIQVPVPLRSCESCDDRFIRFNRLSQTPFPVNPSAPGPPHYPLHAPHAPPLDLVPLQSTQDALP
jgi:hypothetical protein